MSDFKNNINFCQGKSFAVCYRYKTLIIFANKVRCYIIVKFADLSLYKLCDCFSIITITLINCSGLLRPYYMAASLGPCFLPVMLIKYCLLEFLMHTYIDTGNNSLCTCYYYWFATTYIHTGVPEDFL